MYLTAQRPIIKELQENKTNTCAQTKEKTSQLYHLDNNAISVNAVTQTIMQ
jgi:hypothetical protein